MKKTIFKSVCSVSLAVLASAFLIMPASAQGETAEDADNVALGTVATFTNGSNNNDIVGVGAQAGGGDRNTAVGVGAVVAGSNNNVIGYGAAAAGGNDNTAIGVGAVVVGQGDGNQVVGYGAQAGNGSYNTAIGSGATAIGYAQSAFGYGAQANAAGSVALGAGSVADQFDTVSVGRSDYQRRITNVAPGIYDTDAVNVSQLRSADKKIDRVGSMAFAMSALAPMAYDPKDPTQYAAGIGTYNGKAALAVGVYHYTKPNVLLNAAIAYSSDGWEKAARFGVTWKTGGPEPKQLVPATTKEAAPESQESLDLRVKRIMDSYEAGTITNN